MEVFNRVVVVLLLLGTIVVVSAVMVAPRPIIYFLEQWLFFFEDNLFWINWLVFAPTGVFAVILCILLLWLEIRRPRAKAIKIQGIEGGRAWMTAESVASRVEHDVAQLDGVIGATSKVSAGGEGIEVRLDLEVGPDIEVPSKAEEVCRVARQVIEEKMGLRLENVTVNVRHAAYPKA